MESYSEYIIRANNYFDSIQMLSNANGKRYHDTARTSSPCRSSYSSSSSCPASSSTQSSTASSASAPPARSSSIAGSTIGIKRTTPGGNTERWCLCLSLGPYHTESCIFLLSQLDPEQAELIKISHQEVCLEQVRQAMEDINEENSQHRQSPNPNQMEN